MEIDPEGKAITVAAPPIDLSSLNASVTCSNGATVTTVPSLSDGQIVTLAVTDADGAVEEWTLTVNLERGISFKFNGERVFLLNGFTNSLDHVDAADWGNGVPGASYAPLIPCIDIIVVASLYDWGTTTEQPPEYANITIPGAVVGQYDHDVGFTFYYWNEDQTIDFDPVSGMVDLSEGAATAGEHVVGTFTAEGDDSGGQMLVAQDAASVTEGFFKVKRIADNMWSGGGEAD